MRVWGKIPWIFTAVSQAKIDPWILGQNVAGILLCTAQLALYTPLPPKSKLTTARVIGVTALTGLAAVSSQLLRNRV